MKSSILENLNKSIPLETRIRVSIETHFIVKNGGSILTPLDDKGEPLPEVEELNNKCLKLAKPLIEWVLEDIEEWKKDGCP